jgi:uncharacterized protein (DUF302 family)
MSTSTDLSVEEAEQTVRDALADEGFGILTEIDVAATLREKLGVEHAPYKILGACSPQLAAQALEVEPEIGLLLPCNVVVYAGPEGTVVAALEPMTMTQLTQNPEIEPIAKEARTRLQRVIESVPRS